MTNLNLAVFILLCTLNLIHSTHSNQQNVLSTNFENVSLSNNFDLPPMPSLDDSNFESLGSVEILKNLSDRTIRSSFFNSRSSSDINSEETAIDNSSPLKLVIKSMNTFNFKLFSYLLNKYDNIIISPISLYSNLIALHAASSGTTEAQLSKLLALTGVSDTKIADGYRDILSSMQFKRNDNRQKLKLFNRMLVDKKINVSPAYVKKMKNFYNMEIQRVDFSTESEQIYESVNKRVNQGTEGNIPTIMDERPDPLSKLLILNAVHFQSEWAKSFNPKNTNPMAFQNKDGTISRVRMMKIINEFKVHCDSIRARGPNPPICAIDIPYVGSTSMLIIQSANAKISLKDAVEIRIDSQFLQELDSKLSPKFVELGLPSFQLKDTHELREPMDFLGANSMFTKERANLDKFLNTRSSANATATDKKDANVDLFVNQFRHKASISVDEKGTVASAATSVLIGNRSGNNKFYVDRPFIFVIRDFQTGVIMFIGRINNLPSVE